MEQTLDTTMAPRPPASIANAWRRYLAAVRNADPEEYEEVEEEAWRELRADLFWLERALSLSSAGSGPGVRSPAVTSES